MIEDLEAQGEKDRTDHSDDLEIVHPHPDQLQTANHRWGKNGSVSPRAVQTAPKGQREDG